MQGDNISTVGYSVLWRVFSTVEGYVQYCGEITAVQVGIALVLWGIPSILWRLFSTVGDNISTVEGIQYVEETTSVHAGE